MSLKIALLGIFHESNTFVRTRTSHTDFKNGYLFMGCDIRRQYEDAHHEIGGVLEIMDRRGIDVHMVMFAEANPGGVISSDTYDCLLNEMMNGLKKVMPVDGCLAVIHGAAVSEAYPDMDGHCLSILRKELGNNVPVIGTIDPHANVSELMISSTDALLAYKTNPHIDRRETGRRAAKMLADILENRIKPVQAYYQPDVVISIEQQHTDSSPCKELYDEAKKIEGQPGVLSASVILGYPYADVKEMGSGFIVVTDDNRQLAQSSSKHLADYLWRNRHEFVGKKTSIEEAIARIDNSKKPVLLLDMGDNVGAGSPGDGTVLLSALENKGKWKSFICIKDSGNVEQAVYCKSGDRIRLTVGAKADDFHGSPVTVSAKIISIHDGKFTETEPRHGGQVNYDMGKTVIVETDKGTTIMLTTLKILPFSLRQLTSFGIVPGNFDVIVAKGVIGPIAAYSAVCRTKILVNTSGSTVADVTHLQYRNRRKPLFPFENI
jgi:microcystin degradation protein MlrC